jgi:hypothetical protein
LPTNISYVVPVHYLERLLDQVEEDGVVVAPDDALTIDEMVSSKQVVSVLEQGRRFEVQEIRPAKQVTESRRFTEVRARNVRPDRE